MDFFILIFRRKKIWEYIRFNLVVVEVDDRPLLIIIILIAHLEISGF